MEQPGGVVGARREATRAARVARLGRRDTDTDQPGLFTPFHRGANAMDEAVQGSGLGLAIVRSIVTEHGGAVSVRSALGSGSTFTLTLPEMVPAAIH